MLDCANEAKLFQVVEFVADFFLYLTMTKVESNAELQLCEETKNELLCYYQSF